MREKYRPSSHRAAILLGLSALVSTAVHAAVPSGCSALATLTLPDTKLTAAATVGPKFQPPQPSFAYFNSGPIERPFCRVTGVISPAINFEVWLPPVGEWNGRLHAVGSGGLAGSINYAGLKASLEAGYAAVATDYGHQGGVLDGKFAIGRPDLVRDWAYRATHETTVNAKSIVKTFYEKPASYSYLVGCSGGGRAGLSSAQRYPDDFDGILAGDPAFEFTHLAVGGRLWQALANLDPATQTNLLTEKDVQLIASAVNARCDAIDGIKDGVLDDPRRCDFEPKMIQCATPTSTGPSTGSGRTDPSTGSGQTGCLTPRQVAALEKIYAGATTSKGVQIYPGYEKGGELGASGWARNFAGAKPFEGVQWIYAKAVLQGMVFEDTKYDPRSFNYDADVARMDNKIVMGETLASLVNATNPDLSKFAVSGGKLIHYHGWADSGAAPRANINYYESVIRRTSGGKAKRYQKSLRDTQSYYRLFMVPGMQHCLGGPGPNAFGASFQLPVPKDPEHNILLALERWVERGIAPDSVIATKYVDDDPRKGILRTRPICPYPRVAKYLGSGSTDVAANFECRDPEPLGNPQSARPERNR